eukprot:scaffold44014_cov56-Attheya_sp.AAC.3
MISEVASRQLVLDIEAFPSKKPIYILNLRPEIYGEQRSELRQSARSRWYYLHRLKQERPEVYLKLLKYSHSEEIQEEAPQSVKKDKEDSESKWEQGFETRNTSWSTYRSPPNSSEHQENNTSDSEEEQQDIMDEYYNSPPVTRSKMTRGKAISVARATGVPYPPPRNNSDSYVSMEEAFQIDYDDDFPELHDEFMMWDIKEMKLGYEIFSYISIVKKHSEDLRDQTKTKIKVILGGTALMIETASVPSWFHVDYKELFSPNQVTPHPSIMDAHQTFITDYTDNLDKGDKSRALTKTLVRLKEGLVVSADNTSNVPHEDKYIGNPAIYHSPRILTVPAGRTNQAVYQRFHVPFWQIRVIPKKARKLKRDEVDDDDVASMFAAKLSVSEGQGRRSGRRNAPRAPPPRSQRAPSVAMSPSESVQLTRSPVVTSPFGSADSVAARSSHWHGPVVGTSPVARGRPSIANISNNDSQSMVSAMADEAGYDSPERKRKRDLSSPDDADALLSPASVEGGDY